MTVLVLDAGALIALDRGDRAMWARLRTASDAGDIVAVPTGVIAQTWRGGCRQAQLARALLHCHEVVLDAAVARSCGRLCARTDTDDVIDASVAVAAAHFTAVEHTVVATSDHHDIVALTAALNADVKVLRV